MDQSNELGEAGDRKSLVISRLQLFEQINADRNDVKNHVGVLKKPVSASPRNSSGSDPDDDSNRNVNCVNSISSVSDSRIESREKHIRGVQQNHKDRSKKQTARYKENDLSAGLKFLQNDSPCSKRISYNIAVSKGEFAKILPREQPKPKDVINESDQEEEVFEKSKSESAIPINNDDSAISEDSVEAPKRIDDSVISKKSVETSRSNDDSTISKDVVEASKSDDDSTNSKESAEASKSDNDLVISVESIKTPKSDEDSAIIKESVEAPTSNDDSAIIKESVEAPTSNDDFAITKESIEASKSDDNFAISKESVEASKSGEDSVNEEQLVQVLPHEPVKSHTIVESDHQKDTPENRDSLESINQEEIVEILPTEPSRSIDTIEESNTDIVKEPETCGSSNDIVSHVNTDQPTTEILPNVVDGNIEDLSNTKLAENNISVISSSRITNSNASRTDKKHYRNSKNHQDYPQELNPFGDDDEEPRTKESNNPFDSDDDEQPETEPKGTLKVSTNPFWSGSEEEEDDKSDSVSLKKTPVPLPRTVKKPIVQLSPQPSPKPRIKSTIEELTIDDASPSPSRRSFQSSRRKLSGYSLDVSFQRSPGSQSANSTLHKKKPAPPPPIPVKTANNTNQNQNRSNEQINEPSAVVEQNTRKVTTSPWKNKKGPAPARPIPLRRPVKEMPIEDIKIELCDIEVRQQELDRQGKQLDEMIRDRTNADNSGDASSSEELVLQLFEIVNEKNELLRRQSGLMYMRKMHNLEEEHAEIEYQYRCLMLQPDSNKTDSDKTKEEELLRRLMEVVDKRDEIVEAMENDRLRETAEDKSVTKQLDETNCGKDEKQIKKSKKSKKEKVKEHKEEDGKSADSKHSPSKVIKQKFMTLRHSAKKLSPKIPH